MIEAIGILLGILGLLFAFETPRKKLLSLFWRCQEIEHQFKIQTTFHAHNDGNELGPLGTNKTDKKYRLLWIAKNATGESIQVERGIFMKQAIPGLPAVLLIPPEFTKEQTLLPGHKVELLSLELSPTEVNHYRHWVRECNSFGVKGTDGKEYSIAQNQFVAFGVGLEKIAKEYGLEEVLPPGKKVVVKVERKA